ncbi:MAG: hypothetical protein J4G13_15800 [Dehalococcoidia bacterium]|nr:hypothetical protein [Dehalococcoidia bacterium]
MQAKYYSEDDALVISGTRRGRSGAALRDDFGVILDLADEDSEDVTRIDILNVSWFLPLSSERGYDADTDTLTLGDKPDADADYRVVDNGDFVSYRQWFDDGSQWDVVALDLRQASKYLAEVIAARPQSAAVGS